MKLYNYYHALSDVEKRQFAEHCQTTRSYLEKFTLSKNAKYRRIPKETSMALILEASNGSLTGRDVLSWFYPRLLKGDTSPEVMEQKKRCRETADQLTTRAADQSGLADQGKKGINHISKRKADSPSTGVAPRDQSKNNEVDYAI